uniref:Uncharacterized protein n=1 Tax=Anguilla anguilla TaxID=7936 RepID=A0A0E9SBA7_ANGAN
MFLQADIRHNVNYMKLHCLKLVLPRLFLHSLPYLSLNYTSVFML